MGVATRAAAAASRVVLVSAPVGYDKGRFAWETARRIGPLSVATLPTDGEASSSARAVFEALISRDERRVRRSAADRLSHHALSAQSAWRELLRREWGVSEQRNVFVIRDPSGVLTSPLGADLLGELADDLPAGRTLVLTTRVPLPPAFRDIGDPATMSIVSAADLAFGERDLVAHAAELRLDWRFGHALHRLARGWPMVSRLVLELVRGGERFEDLVEAAGALDETTLLTFVAHRVIARLDAPARDALIVTVLLAGASHGHLVRILGGVCDDAVLSSLLSLPFVVTAAGRLRVHPDIGKMLETRFAHVVRPLYERTLNALIGDAEYAEAASVALRRGEPSRAAAILDAAPSYVSAPVPLAAYERVIDRLDRDVITRFPNVWIATMPYRSFAVDRATFVREAETVYYCLPRNAVPAQRARALMLLASALKNIGRGSEADRLVTEALETFARDDREARSSLLGFSAWSHGNDGRFARARELAEEAARLSHGDFTENQALHYIEMHEAAYRGQNERTKVIIDELLRREQTPLHRAFTAGNGALVTWVNGDDEAFLRYITVLDDTLTPGLERGFRPVIDAARGSLSSFDDAYLWPVMRAVIHLFHIGNAATADEATTAAHDAARAGDEKGDPYVRILAYSALYVRDVANRPDYATTLRATANGIESEELRSAVNALIDGAPAGILESFVQRRVRRSESIVAAAPLVVRLLSARVVRGEAAIKLSDKEFELLALLGSSPAALSRERIGEALWDHLDPEEWANNLKVTLSRLRAKLGMRDAVVVMDGRYRLSPLIEVDLRTAEALIRGGLAARPDEENAALIDLVDTFSAAPSGRYERFSWAHGLRARMEGIVCTAAVTLAKRALDAGRLDEARRYASTAAAVDQYDETACEVSIRALLARGDVDSARREFRRYGATLAADLGATPSERLAGLVGLTSLRVPTDP